MVVNEILSDHNVDKQMTDSRGDVSGQARKQTILAQLRAQVAYLMTDISDVDHAKIKDLYERLENLSCGSFVSNDVQIPY